MKGKFVKASIIYRLRYLFLLIKNKFKTTAVLFYPQYPHKRTVMYKICEFMGYNIRTNPKRHYDLAINWENTTFRENDPVLEKIARKKKVLNINCKNISKNNVDRLFKQVFGYGLIIDPLKYRGKCVQKNNLNAQKDGRIINCPVKRKEKEFVYLKLLDNRLSESLVQDIRVPVYNGRIPLLFLRNKLIKDRFINTNDTVAPADPADIFSGPEIKKIILFCRKIGLDFGELDIIRNKDDGKIYIVDVNNTPWGPPNHLEKKEWKKALKKLALLFDDIWGMKTI